MEYLRLFHFRNEHGKTKYNESKIYVSNEMGKYPIYLKRLKIFLKIMLQKS